MDTTVAVAHYPEGAGHATRMLAVAKAIEAAGASVELAGGGAGSRFIGLNGYSQYEPATVDYIGDFQNGGNLLHVLSHSVPVSGKRVVDFVGWLRRIDPDALVTDDMFAAMAAPLAGTPLYVLTHNAASFYETTVQRVFTKLLTGYQLAAGREFLYPAVWPPSADDPEGVTRIPPIALEGESDGRAVGDVLVVPSTYSEGFDALVDRLRVDGHDVTQVGTEEWDPVPSLLPLVREAEVVVCSGYSTVMEAAVAGTPCVIYPFTDEQRGVARTIERAGVPGFRVEHSVPHVARAIERPPNAPEHENGAPVAAERILADL